jgi:membrane-associated phospholipid phosphatase
MGRPAWLALGFATCFVVLAVLVKTGVAQPLDAQAIMLLRPGDAWGPTQVRWSPWMSRLQPDRMYLLLAVTALAASAWRRSPWPALFGAALALASVALTVLVKFALARPDPHGYVTGTGGSYPSGHMVAVLVCLAGCLLLLRPRVRWWWWSPVAVAAALMTTALLVSAAHWPTDVLGAVFLSLALVSVGSSLRLRQRAIVSGPSPGGRSGPTPRNSSSRGATTSAS